VKGLFGLPAFLTKRDAQANPLDDASFLPAPRAIDDTPANLAALVPAHDPSPRGGKLSDLQQSLVALSAVLGGAGGAGAPRPAVGGRGEIQSP
jgi:hypothetical protein